MQYRAFWGSKQVESKYPVTIMVVTAADVDNLAPLIVVSFIITSCVR